MIINDEIRNLALQALCNDEAKQVFADWLEEHGSSMSNFMKPCPYRSDQDLWRKNANEFLNAIVQRRLTKV